MKLPLHTQPGRRSISDFTLIELLVITYNS